MAIAAALAGRRPVADGLAHGAAGAALFEVELESSGWTPAGPAAARVARSVRSLTGRTPDLSLFRGLTGLGLVATAVNHGGGAGLSGFCAELDQRIVPRLAVSTWRGPIDLMDGLVGIGVYGLARQGARHAEAIVTGVIARLTERTTRGDGARTWGCRADQATDQGVAHGPAGLIGFLASCIERGISVDAAHHQMEAVVTALLQGRKLGAGRGMSESGAMGGELPTAHGLSWCTGDAAIAAVLHRAGMATRNPDWVGRALEIGWLAADRPLGDACIQGPGLCHGSAGAAHVFSHLYRASGEPIFRDAAVEWYRWTLDQRVHGAGTGGFRASRTGPDAASEEDAGFLEGAAGIGCALLAGLQARYSSWDRVLLLS